MGFVSCLEDIQKHLDDSSRAFDQGMRDHEIQLRNYEQRNKLSFIRSDLEVTVMQFKNIRSLCNGLQRQINKLIEVVTNPEISPIIELQDIKERYQATQALNERLKKELTEEREIRELLAQELDDIQKQFQEMTKTLAQESSIAEYTNAKFYKEQELRRQLEARLHAVAKDATGRKDEPIRKSHRKS